MPGSLEPRGYQRHCEGKLLGVVFSEPIQQLRYLSDARAVEFIDCGRQCVVEFRQGVACAQHVQHLGQVAIGRVRSGIGREFDAGLLDAIWRTKRALEIFHDLGLERAGNLLYFSLVVGGDQNPHLVLIVACHRRQ